MADGSQGVPAGTDRLSVTGRRWQMRPVEDRQVRAVAQVSGLVEPAARVLAGRGVGPQDALAYLTPTLRHQMPDPSVVVDMDKAAGRLADAIEAGARLAVFADYDVDGGASAAIVIRLLRALGSNADLYVPDRQREGYGLNAAGLQYLARSGVDLVVAVDCGTTSFAAIDAATQAGLEVIVVDHHAAEVRHPAALALVNPNRVDDRSGLGDLPAAGLCFLLAVAVVRALRTRGRFDGRPEPDLMRLLDLVALATVCDVAPMTGLNRVLVRQGLKVMARRGNAGLVALADRAGLRTAPDVGHLGFLFGPRINAGGRIGRCDLGASLLATDDPVEAARLADLLDSHNEDRKAIEADVLTQARRQVESDGAAPPVVVAAGRGWHPGVIGIVAGRLKELYHRPTCVIALDGDTGKGSGRSMPGFDLGAAVLAARQAGLLTNGGGHPMAAGFTVAADRVAAFGAFLAERAKDAEREAAVPVLDLDGSLSTGGATLDLARCMAAIGPFGPGNPEPRFVIRDAVLRWAEPVGKGHLRCNLDGVGGRLAAIAFRAMDTPLGEALRCAVGSPVGLAGRLTVNSWQGRETAQLIIDDAMDAWWPPADQAAGQSDR